MVDQNFKHIGDPRDHAIEESIEIINELTIVINELSKFIKEICKARRFGMFDHHPLEPLKPNIIRILSEIEDVNFVTDKLKTFLMNHIKDVPELMEIYDKLFDKPVESDDPHENEEFAFDSFNQKVYIGDTVMFIEPYYHNMKQGKIVRITPSGATIESTSRHKTSSLKKYPRLQNQYVKVTTNE